MSHKKFEISNCEKYKLVLLNSIKSKRGCMKNYIFTYMSPIFHMFMIFIVVAQFNESSESTH
jgi:hypothetical protein